MGPYVSNIALLTYYDFFCFSLLNFGYSGSIWGSTPHGLLHENKYKNIKIIKQADQDPRMSGICNPNKTLAKLTCNIKIKTNNITLIVNTNSHA